MISDVVTHVIKFQNAPGQILNIESTLSCHGESERRERREGLGARGDGLGLVFQHVRLEQGLEQVNMVQDLYSRQGQRQLNRQVAS